MSDKRYEANIIRTTAVEPANNLETTSAPGVWSLDEVMELQKKNKWPTVGNVAIDVDEVFSNFLYTGNGSSSARTFVNGINLADNGGLVWTKMRSEVADHELVSSDSNYLKELKSNTTQQAFNNNISFVANNNGYGFSTAASRWNENTRDMVSWTFRKAAKFFDIQTWSGDDTAPRTISHNLGCQAGMVIVKDIVGGGTNWFIAHRSQSGKVAYFTTGSFFSSSYISNLSSSSSFTIGDTALNSTGRDYVAYIFAHNNNDGGFGPDQDADIIKCGSYTGNGSNSGPSIDLGFEPQWVMIKRANNDTGDWKIFDAMRGVATGGTTNLLEPNTSDAEVANNDIDFDANGFNVINSNARINASGSDYIYMAIRRGPLAQPTSATNVFAIDTAGGGPPTFTSGFPVDLSIFKNVASSSGDWNLFDRIRGDAKELNTNSGAAESANAGTYYNQDLMTGIGTNTGTSVNSYQWMWKRAPSYLDVVAYTGDGNAGRTVSHNLGVAPEMIWVKQRNITQSWQVYHQGMDASAPQDYYMQIDSSGARSDNSNRWNDTAPTSSVFTIGTAASVNGSGGDFIAYLFATVAGVSKVGSYDGNGSNQNIDCGFSSGAKFILIKSIQSGSWYVFDTVRGIVAGNDSHLKLNSTDAEAYADSIDTYSSGFNVVQNSTTDLNKGPSDESYIFYAIAT